MSGNSYTRADEERLRAEVEAHPQPICPAAAQVWVAETWSAHGEAQMVLGVYVTREAAFRALRALRNMSVYVDDSGDVQARPRSEKPQRPQRVPCNHPEGPAHCPCGGKGHRPYPPAAAEPVRWGHAFPARVQE